MFRRVLLALLVFLSVPALSAERVVKMASLEWPPFSGAGLPGGGIAVAIAREAFKTSGYTLEVDYLPWTEATQKGGTAPYSGYFPAYREEVGAGFVPSNANFETPLRVAQRKEAPLTFKTLADLKGKTMGVVEGYGNTAEFDAMVAAGDLKIVASADDGANLMALIAGKVDGAMVDGNVFIQSIAFDERLAKSKRLLELNATVVAPKDLFVAFPDTPEGRKIRDAYNTGLSKTDVNAIYAAFLSFAQGN